MHECTRAAFVDELQKISSSFIPQGGEMEALREIEVENAHAIAEAARAVATGTQYARNTAALLSGTPVKPGPFRRSLTLVGSWAGREAAQKERIARLLEEEIKQAGAPMPGWKPRTRSVKTPQDGTTQLQKSLERDAMRPAKPTAPGPPTIGQQATLEDPVG